MTREKDHWIRKRKAMVKLLEGKGIRDRRILEAMGNVKRHLFIPQYHRFQRLEDPYGDFPLPIGYGQTISQPFIVAYMLERMLLSPGDRVLEIGTGSGYVAAVLDEMGIQVFTIEILPELARKAGELLSSRVHIREGNGHSGWPEMAPFNAIVVSCAPENIPDALVDQLEENGRMILPVGEMIQRLIVLRKKDGEIHHREDLPVRFVPMVH